MRTRNKLRLYLAVALPVLLLLTALVYLPSLLGMWASRNSNEPDNRADSGEIQIELSGEALAETEAGSEPELEAELEPESPTEHSPGTTLLNIDLVPIPAQAVTLPQSGDIPDFTISLNDGTKKSVVFEEYIKGVIAAEMPVSFELEALKAQAVAARTYAIRKLNASKKTELCTDPAHCQAYMDKEARKKAWGSSFEKNEAQITKATEATRGQILTYDGEPIEAFFHSTSGGYTEDVESVFSQKLPYLRSVASRGEEAAPRYSGEKRVGIKAFIKAINAKYPKAQLEEKDLQEQVEIISRTGSGRAATLRIGGETAKATDIRQLFKLDSTNFTIVLEADSLLFKTIGYGHGVGMSQVGANQMALSGARYDEILYHYYTGTAIEIMDV